MYFQQGGQEAQIMQIIQQYAQLNQIDPKELLDQFKQMPPEQQQQAIQQMVQTLKQGAPLQEAAMAYGGYTTGMFAVGGEMIRRADGSYSKRGLWDNIRANKGSGKKPTKEMLDQEKKIRAQEAAYGGVYANGGTNNAGFQALPDYVQSKILSNMGYGGYHVMEDGGESNASMAMGQIAAMHDKLSRLQKFINSSDTEVDPWVASKITLADDYLNTVADYMQYGEQQEPKDEMPGAGYKRGGSTFSGNAWYQIGGSTITDTDGYIPEYAEMAYGGIHIKPANRGKFTASAKKAGMGVQEFASHVLANKDKYSSTQVKRANFAKNAAGWKKQMGGLTEGDVLDVTPEQLQMLKQGGYNFEIID